MKLIKYSFLILAIMLMACCTFTSCKKNSISNSAELVLGGEHPIKPMLISDSINHYLLISSNEKNSPTLSFMFLNYKDKYQTMNRPLDDIQFNFDNTIVSPYIKFYWRPSSQCSLDINTEWQRLYNLVTRVVIYGSEKDLSMSNIK